MWRRKQQEVSRRQLAEYGNTLVRGTTVPAGGIDLGWVGRLDAHERAAFLSDLRAAIDECAASGDAGVLERVLHRWRLTAGALDTAGMREALLTDEGE